VCVCVCGFVWYVCVYVCVCVCMYVTRYNNSPLHMVSTVEVYSTFDEQKTDLLVTGLNISSNFCTTQITEY